MRLIETADYQEMSRKAAAFIEAAIAEKPDLILGLATGGTVTGTYEQLIRDFRSGKVTFQRAASFNLDEYEGMRKEDRNSYHYYMEENFFKHVDFQKGKNHLPDGMAQDMEEACREYDRLMEEYGGIDLQLLGIGENGHIGFNEPGTPFETKTHLVRLTPSTKAANARYFNSAEEVPDRAVTMGIASILKSRQILLLASGIKKADILKKLADKEVTEDIPATVLKQHSNVVIIADKDALSKLTEEQKKVLGHD